MTVPELRAGTRPERPMGLPPALLEHWMRDYYFAVDHDIGSSGVEEWSFRDLRRIVGMELEELDELAFHDSQTLGGPDVRRTVAERFADGDVQRVMVTHGSTEANFLAMHALLAPGDTVLTVDPCYQQLHSIAEAIGCRIRHWPLRAANRFHPDLDELPRLLTGDVRMVVVNFPHNPTGATLSPEEQDELLRRVAAAGSYLLWDGAFSELTHDAPPLPEPSGRYERAVSLGTVSKAYGLPGLRVGWCLAAPEILARMVELRDYVTLHLSPLVELIAERALRYGDEIVSRRLAQAAVGLERVRAWSAARPHQVEWVEPRGGVTCFPGLPTVPDVEALCHRLGREERVLLVPGACFGHPQRVRLGFGGRPECLEAGLERLGALLDREPAVPVESLGRG
jgi:capreomycidine synthase